jgi:hypothetical protein
MKRHRHTPEQVIRKLREGERLSEQPAARSGGCGELVQPTGDARGEQRTPHPAVLTCGYPEGRWRRAAPCLVSRKMFRLRSGTGTSARLRRPARR